MEAARSLGMTHWQAMRSVILPQAVRNVLPPLGNDFIAMLKDSSLVSVLGVQDITQLGKVYSCEHLPFLRDVQRGRVPVPGDDRGAGAARAVAGAAVEGGFVRGGSIKR
jgi:hypothetical protein